MFEPKKLNLHIWFKNEKSIILSLKIANKEKNDIIPWGI